MLTKNEGYQNKIETVMIKNLVSEYHLLKRIAKYIDLSFIYDLVEDKYCLDNGRPSIVERSFADAKELIIFIQLGVYKDTMFIG